MAKPNLLAFSLLLLACFSFAASDLYVSSIWFDHYSNYLPCNTEIKVPLTVQIRNNGTTSSLVTVTELKIDSTYYYLQTESVKPFGGYVNVQLGSAERSFTVVCPPLQHTVSAFADNTAQENETDESNNKLTVIFASTQFCGDLNCDFGENYSSCPWDCLPSGHSLCGNGVCEEDEDCFNCKGDCGTCCGNGRCEKDENCFNCQSDCGRCCGDGRCDHGELCYTCKMDCGACTGQNSYCGDLSCDKDENCLACPKDCGACASICGDELCDASENCTSCERDCGVCKNVCGNGLCESANSETCTTCEKDCGACPSRCGDGKCDANETCISCRADCGLCCGNNFCDNNENCMTCEKDCGKCPPLCGDGSCNANESCSSCPSDCGACKCEQRKSCSDKKTIESISSDCKKTFSSCGSGLICSEGECISEIGEVPRKENPWNSPCGFPLAILGAICLLIFFKK